jgi:hypothetical protein
MCEPTRGLEPLTARLQVGCATNCATSAGHGNKPRDKSRDNAGDNSAAASGPVILGCRVKPQTHVADAEGVASKDEKARRKQLKDAYLRADQAASAALMPLDRPQLESLLDHVDAAVASRGCDHTRKATDDWATQHGVELSRLHAGLEEYGGFCDCEVVMNVDPAAVFEPVRQPRQ